MGACGLGRSYAENSIPFHVPFEHSCPRLRPAAPIVVPSVCLVACCSGLRSSPAESAREGGVKCSGGLGVFLSYMSHYLDGPYPFPEMDSVIDSQRLDHPLGLWLALVHRLGLWLKREKKDIRDSFP